MTREEAKELLPIIQAFAEGKTVQYKNDFCEWEDVKIGENLGFTESPSTYRIKPELKYRPFKTQEECWSEMLKHQPFGWFRSTCNKNLFNVVCINNECIKIANTLAKYTDTYSDAFTNIEFVDGTPFGIKEEIGNSAVEQ